MKKTSSIPAADVLAAHEQAAIEIGELRRKGVPCHLEEHADATGHRIDIVKEPPPDSDPPQATRGGSGRYPQRSRR